MDESPENTGAQEVLSTSGIGFQFVRYFLLAILAVVGCMVGLVVLLGWHLGMDVTVKGRGHVQPITRHVVKTKRPGLIKQVYVKHGQKVEQHTLLISLDNADLRNEVEQIENELRLNGIQRLSLPAELDRERAIIKMDIARAEADRDTEILHMERARVEFEFYHSVLPFHKHKDYKHPIDKLIPMREHKLKLQKAEVEIEHAKRRITALDTRAQKLNELRQIAKKLSTQHRLLETHVKQMEIHAPVSGTVLTRDLDKRVGDYLEAGEAVLELAELSGWQAQVMIPEVDIPKVKIGQIVKLYVDAFPHMQYKVFEGTVAEIPRKPEATAELAQGTFYGVKIHIEDPVVTDGAKQYSLAYGMGVEAKIVTERGPIVELLWKKFLKTVGRFEQPEIYRLE